MKIKFEVEKILKFEPIEVELTDEQVVKIREYADKNKLSFQEAFQIYGDMSGVLYDIMWDVDNDDHDWNIWDVEIED